MASTTFVTGTVIPASWLNDVDAAVYGVESFGAVGDGATDDTAALQAALDAAASAGGGLIYLLPGTTYRVSSRLNVASKCGIFSDGTGKLYATAAGFSNATLANKYQSNSAVISCSGLKIAPYTPTTGIILKDFIIESQVSAGRLVDAITIQNSIHPVVSGVEIYGFPVGCGIRASSLDGGLFSHNHIHDFTDNTSWGVGSPQLTGIELDNDLVNSVSSHHTVIDSNYIHDLTVGATFIAAHGYQTDGITVAKSSTYSVSILNNTVDTVGEGVDCFGLSCSIVGNSVSNCYNYGIKLVNGAKSCVISGCSVYNAGLGGIVLSGTSAVGLTDTEDNLVSGCSVKNLDYNGAWTANDSACLLITDNGGATGKPRNNVVTGCTFNEGTAGKYGWLDSSTGSNNFGEGNSFIAGAANVRRVLINGGAGTSRLAGSATYQTNLV